MSATADVAARVAALETAEEARNLIAAYARAVDSQDIDALGQVFGKHAVLRSRDRRHEGIDEIEAFFRAEFAVNPCANRHFVSNVRVTDATPDAASVSAYFIFVTASGGTSIVGWGSYADRMTRIDRELRIVDKFITVDHRGPADRGWAERLAAEVATR